MKRITLFLLAALFVAAGSMAQGKPLARPLSQQPQLKGLAVKQQPSRQSLQKQQGIELQQGLRQVAASHAKSLGKTLAKKHHPAALRKAPARIIKEQPQGQQVFYSRSGSAYYSMWGYVLETSLSGAVGNVVFGPDNTVYIHNLVSQAGTDSWVEGTLQGNSIVIQLPQVAMEFPDAGYNLEVAMVQYDAAEQWYAKSAKQTLTLSYDPATGNISSKSGDYVGLCYDDDDSWSGYADWDMSFTAVTDKLVEAPANLQTTTYSLSADGYQGSLVEVGFSGDDVYVQGIDPNLPDTWVKGTISGNKVTFKNGQYVGADVEAGYHQYLMSATAEELYDSYYDEYYTEYSLADNDIVFDYDASTKTLSNSSLFLLNGGKTAVNYMSVLDKAQMAPFVEVAATPATPQITELFEGGASYFFNGYGWGYISFDLPAADVDGNYILPDKLSYVLWVRVNGEERPLSLSWWDYRNQEEETMTEIPYAYTDDWDIYSTGLSKEVYYYVVGPEAYGVQAIYRGAGEEHRSEIAWAEVEGMGAEVQPAAAQPAYPDATIGASDNRIDYTLVTGDETISAVSNNSKPETYDVAIRLSDPAFAGTLIESITIPLQEVEGISDVSVFLTSQLRVENGRNAADLVVKGITPDEAGYITVTLDKPYTIPAEGVYVGYSLTVNDVEEFEANAMPIAVINKATEGGFYMHTSDGFLKWLDVSELFGNSLLINVTLAGASIKGNAVALADGDVHYVMTGQAAELPLTVVNHGAQGIQSLEIAYTLAGQTGTQSFTLDVPASFGYQATVPFTIPALAEKGNYELALTVTKVNGVANEDASAATDIPVIALNTLPKKRTLLEEYTGFWCGYCPRGFVALEKLAELYPDEYVLASYHNADQLEIMDADNFPSYVDGFPGAWMDRVTDLDAYYGTDETYSIDFNIADDLADRNKQFGQADISVVPVISTDQSSVRITANVTFPFDMADGDYSVEYILLADGLTDPAWGQSNYFANGAQGYPQYMDAFTEATDNYFYGLVFNDVVVLTSELLGGSDNAISEATSDVPVELSYAFDLSDALNTSDEPIIQDLTKLKVAAILIDNNTGAVVNANKAAVTDGSAVGIVEHRSDNSAPAAFYDLMGRSQLKAQHGLNIVRQANGNTRKLIVK